MEAGEGAGRRAPFPAAPHRLKGNERQPCRAAAGGAETWRRLQDAQYSIFSGRQYARRLLFPLSPAVRCGPAAGPVYHQGRAVKRQIHPDAPCGATCPSSRAGDTASAVFRRPGLAGRADPAPIGGGAGGWDGAPGGGIVSTRGAKGKVKGRTFSLKGKSTKKKLLVAKLRFAWGFR